MFESRKPLPSGRGAVTQSSCMRSHSVLYAIALSLYAVALSVS